MVGNANTLIGMGKEPAEVGFLAESESVLEMEGKRLVDFLLLRIVSLQKTQALIVQGSSCLTPTTLIKYSTAWINLSLCPKPLSRRAVSTRTEQCLSKDWLTLKTNYISIMAVPIRRLQ